MSFRVYEFINLVTLKKSKGKNLDINPCPYPFLFYFTSYLIPSNTNHLIVLIFTGLIELSVPLASISISIQSYLPSLEVN